MKANRLAWLGIAVGAVLGVPAAVLVISFVAGLNDTAALNAAPTCATPTLAGTSQCLSEYTGVITSVTPHSKSLDHVTLGVGAASYDLGYDCQLSAGACKRVSLRSGTAIVAGWWRGELVLFGAAESRPAVITEFHPLEQLRSKVLLLNFLLTPSVAFILAGVLFLQAPMSIDDLVKHALAKWPNPPRSVDGGLVWRVALGYWAPAGLMAWFMVNMVAAIMLISLAALSLTLPVYGATFVVTFAASVVVAGRYLTRMVRDSGYRHLTVRQVQSGMGKNRQDTVVSYDLLEGTTATTTLGPNWNGLVNVGDVLDALTNPKTGSMVRLLSSPPVQA